MSDALKSMEATARTLTGACKMVGLPGESRVGEELAKGALRRFGTAPERDDPRWELDAFKFTIQSMDAPLPVLFRYPLTLIGCAAHGPAEKVAWWVNFTFDGELCQLAHQKFGLRLFSHTDRSESEAVATQRAIVGKLKSTNRSIEQLITNAAGSILGAGNATVLNQHHSLRRAYEYFRERAENPMLIPDELTSGSSTVGTWTSFVSGKSSMQLNSSHDLVAAITAYLSVLEHDLVLAFAFEGFDPAADNVTDFIGDRWAVKWKRVLGEHANAGALRQRLTEVVETWRNPYAHGGFEKGQGATVWIHTPGVGAAIPIGLTRVRDRPRFSMTGARAADISEVFALFDEIDEWMCMELPEATKWLESGLDVRYDESFRTSFSAARDQGDFDVFLEYHDRLQSDAENMDF